MSENDGKNERQLTDWASLGQYLEATTLARMRSPPLWYADVISDALISWLLWMSLSRSRPFYNPQNCRKTYYRIPQLQIQSCNQGSIS